MISRLVQASVLVLAALLIMVNLLVDLAMPFLIPGSIRTDEWKMMAEDGAGAAVNGYEESAIAPRHRRRPWLSRTSDTGLYYRRRHAAGRGGRAWIPPGL